MKKQIQMVVMAMAAALLGACGTVDPGDRGLLRQQAQASIADFKRADSSLEPLLNSSHAYVVFPRITTGAVGAGGAYGKGEVYQNGKFVGYADVSQGSIGLQLGGQRYAELIMFRTETTYLNFTHNTWEMDARASAIAISAGTAAAADYTKGVLVFTLPENGLMAQAALGVQRFTFRPEAP